MDDILANDGSLERESGGRRQGEEVKAEDEDEEEEEGRVGGSEPDAGRAKRSCSGPRRWMARESEEAERA